jgi:hypothetical protein
MNFCNDHAKGTNVTSIDLCFQILIETKILFREL